MIWVLNCGTLIMIIYVVRLLMDMTIMWVLLILYLTEIFLFPVPGIKLSNYGKLVQDSIQEHIMDIKNGSEMLLSPMIIKPWLLVLMTKVSVFGKWIKRHQSIVFLLMTMWLKLFYLSKANKVNNLWNLSSWNLSLHRSQKSMH